MAMDGGANRLSKALLNHWFPRHQTEPYTVVQHGVAPADEHDTAPVDAGYALSVSYWPML